MPQRFQTHKRLVVGTPHRLPSRPSTTPRSVSTPPSQRQAEDTSKKHHRFYASEKWRRLRMAHLRRHPLCEDCKQGQRFVPATEVHHVRKLVAEWQERCVSQYFMSLCKSCHSRRTRRGE